MPRTLSKEEIESIKQVFREKGTISGTAQETGHSRNTIRKYTEPLKEEEEKERYKGNKSEVPPDPADYGLDLKEEKKIDARTVLKDVIEMQESWGRNAPKGTEDYLLNKADYFGAPTPAELKKWIDSIEGRSEKAVQRVPEDYKTALRRKAQEQKLDRSSIPEDDLNGVSTSSNKFQRRLYNIAPDKDTENRTTNSTLFWYLLSEQF